MTPDTIKVLKAYKKLVEISDEVDESQFEIDHEKDEFLPLHAIRILKLAHELNEIFNPVKVEVIENEN